MDINVASLNKVYCFVSDSSLNGRTVKITDSINTWTKTISSLSCVFMIPSMPAPAKKSYTVMLMNSAGTVAEYSRQIELGFGDSVKIGLFTNDENANKGYVLSEITSHAYSLPTAGSSTKGGVKVTSGTSNGVYMDGEQLKTYLASSSQIGCMKTGTGLTASSGTVSLDTASSSGLGGIKIGNGLQMSSGTASVKLSTGLNVSSSGVYLKPAGTSGSYLGGVYVPSDSGLYLTSDGELKLRAYRANCEISKSLTIPSQTGYKEYIEIPYSNAAYDRIVKHGFIEGISGDSSDVAGFVKTVYVDSSKIGINVFLYNSWSSSQSITKVNVYYAYFSS